MLLKCILIFLFVIFYPIQGSAERKTVSLATSDWIPYVEQSRKNKGFASEVVTQAFSRQGYETKINFMPWTRAVQKTEEGKFNAVFPAYYSEERARSFYLSDEIFKSRLGFYKRKDFNISYTTLRDLTPYCPQNLPKKSSLSTFS